MSKTKQLLRRAQQLWGDNRYNRHAWVRSVTYLGDKWLLAVPVRRM